MVATRSLADTTGSLLIDPYKDFLPEGGRSWPTKTRPGSVEEERGLMGWGRAALAHGPETITICHLRRCPA